MIPEQSAVLVHGLNQEGDTMRLVVLLAALIHCVPAYDVDVKKLEGLARARVESCGG